MRASLESLNTAMNYTVGIILVVVLVIFIIAEIRADYPTWRESHRRVRRKHHEEWVDSVYEQEGLNDVGQDDKKENKDE